MSKQKRKKVPTHRLPVTQQDVKRAKRDATDFACTYVWAVMFTIMRDKFGWGPIRLKRLWDEVIKMSGSIREGYVKVDDLVKVLDEEAGITIESTRRE